MDSFADFSGKKYLGTDDVRGESLILTIKDFGKETIEQDGKEDTVSVVSFEEVDRKVILKSTTSGQLAELFGKPSNAKGKQVEAYFDPTVSFGGKKVGGLRFRAPEGGTDAGKGTAKAPF
jgi:hypothetical protein